MRCTRALFAAACLIAAHAGANDRSLSGIADQATRLQESVMQEPHPEWIRPDPQRIQRQRQIIDEIFSGTQSHIQERLPQGMYQSPTQNQYQDGIEIYVSFSLGETALRQIIQGAAGRGDVLIYFRGIADGENLPSFATRLHDLVQGIEDAPDVLVDPTKFRDRMIQVAPEIVLRRNNRTVARAAGLTGIDTFLELADMYQDVDLGTRGPIEIIAERDLIEEMQERAAALDFEAMKERAIKRFWENVPLYALPTAQQDRVRHIDPTVVLVQDLHDGDGNVIVPAGTRVNPLDQLPFTSRLIVFDARDQKQVEQARRWLRDSPHYSNILVVSDYERTNAWEGWRELELDLNTQVYLLNEQIRSRFDLQVVPSKIEAHDGQFIVTEVAPKDIEDGRDG